MKNLNTITGELSIVSRMNCSSMGNPRFLVAIGDGLYLTEPNAWAAYEVENYKGRTVTAGVRTWHGKPSLVTLSDA